MKKINDDLCSKWRFTSSAFLRDRENLLVLKKEVTAGRGELWGNGFDSKSDFVLKGSPSLNLESPEF